MGLSGESERAHRGCAAGGKFCKTCVMCGADSEQDAAARLGRAIGKTVAKSAKESVQKNCGGEAGERARNRCHNTNERAAACG